MMSPTPGRGSPVVMRLHGLPFALESAMNAVSAGSSIGWVSTEVSIRRAAGEGGPGALMEIPRRLWAHRVAANGPTVGGEQACRQRRGGIRRRARDTWLSLAGEHGQDARDVVAELTHEVAQEVGRRGVVDLAVRSEDLRRELD